MKTSPFKVGDKVMLRVGGTTLDCVAAVRYRFIHEGEPGTQAFFLDLVGKDNPDDREGGWPSTEFRLMWSGDRAAR
jgi:hypothetical protein